MFATAKQPCVGSLHRLEQQTMVLSLKSEPLLSSTLFKWVCTCCVQTPSQLMLCFHGQSVEWCLPND